MDVFLDLVLDQEIARRAGEAGLVEAVVEVLSSREESLTLSYNSRVWATCFRILINFGVHDSDSLRRAGDGGAIEAIVGRLKHTIEADSDSQSSIGSETVAEGLFALQTLEHDTGNHRKCGSAGGVEVVVKVMKAYASNSVIQVRGGCTTLAILGSEEVYHLDVPGIDNRQRVLEAGGVEVIVEAIKSHGNNACNMDVILEGCKVLGCIECDYYHERMTVEDEHRVRKCGAIEAVIEIMRTHAENSVLQGACCFGLSSLLVYEDAENQNRVRELGGIEAVVEVIRAHGGDSSMYVMIVGCALLRSLVYINVENKARVGEAGGICAIIDALRVHRDRDYEDEDGPEDTIISALENKAYISALGCSTLQHLVYGNVENRVRLGEAGIEAIRGHAGEEGLVLGEGWDDRESW